MKQNRISEQVLRQAVLQTRSHALVRPGSPGSPSRQDSAHDDSDSAAAHQAQQERQLAALADEARKRGFEVGHREGLSKGMEDGRSEAQRQLDKRLAKLDTVIAAISAAQSSMVTAVENDMIELALACLGNLLAQHLALPEVVRAQIQQQIERYASEGIVSIRLSLGDHALLHSDSSFAEVLARNAQTTQIRCIPDRSIEAGGCIIETGAGAIDARIESQLEQIKTRLIGVCRDQRGEA